MRVVGDSHAIVWYVQGSRHLSRQAFDAMSEAEASDGLVVSVATLIDLWYVTQTTEAVTADDLSQLRDRLLSSSVVELYPIDLAVIDATTSIPRPVLTDPWDRFIVATAQALDLPLVTRDGRIRDSKLANTIW